MSLTHTALLSEHWDTYGPGAVGVGWEMGLLGMELHLTKPNAPKPDPAEFAMSPDGKALLTGSKRGVGASGGCGRSDPDAAHVGRRLTSVLHGEPDEPA